MPLAASPELRSFLMEREILIDETSVDKVIDSRLRRRCHHPRPAAGGILPDIHPGQQGRNHRPANPVQPTLRAAPSGLPPGARAGGAAEQTLCIKATRCIMTEALWRAYTQLEKDRARGAGERRVLADLVSLVRHAALDEELVPYPERVQVRYQEWLLAQEAQGRGFSPQERWWLDEIARHIGINVSISLEDLNSFGFQGRGGQVAAVRLFGARLPELLEELNAELSE